jgi:hypothetical protein
MSARAFSAVVIGLVVASGASGLLPLRAQSLGDLAKKEEERRQAIKQPAKVYTNKDLGEVPPATAPATTAPDLPPSAPPSASEPSKDASKPEGAGGSKAKDQAYWSGRKKALQDALERDSSFAEALQSRINGLQTDFVNRDDPAQRAVIQANLQKALADLDRQKKQVVTDQKALADLDEEARRAGVPPGWLR